jgi:hypothetical protein
MEYTLNANGKFIVTINGTLYDHCQTDSDCPGQAVCMLNATWSAYPSMCTCRIGLGRSGSSCEVPGPAATSLIVLTVFVLLTGLLMLSFGIIGSFRACTSHKNNGARHNTAHRIVFLAIPTGLVTVLLMILYLARLSGACPMESAGMSKNECLVIPGLVGVAAYFALTLLTLLSVSLTWIQLAVKTRTMSQNGGSRMSTAIYCLAFLFILLVLIFLLMYNNNAVFLVFIVAVAITGITYLIGAATLKFAVGPSNSSRTHEILQEIRHYAVCIAILSLVRLSFCSYHRLQLTDTHISS